MEDWIETELGEICEIINGKNQKNVVDPNGKFPIYGSGGIIGFANDFLCPPQTTIVGRKGNINSPIFVKENFWNVDTAFGFVPCSNLENKLLFYFCQSFNFKKLDKSTTIPSLAKRDLLKINFNLPPLSIQKAIVTKLESLLTNLDKGIEHLEKAAAQLKIYRQAVLKKAFEGELTKAWRAQQADLRSAEELLEEIKKERVKFFERKMEEWEVAKKEWEENGKINKRPTKPKKLIEYQEIDKNDIKEKIAKGWSFINLGSLIDEPKYGTSKKCDYEIEGKGVLRIPNVKKGFIDNSDLKFAKFTNEEIGAYQLIENDILTIRSNGSVNLVGKVALVRDMDCEYLYAGYLIRLRPIIKIANSKFLIYCFISGALRNQIESKAKSTSGVNNINTGELQSLIFPICSKKEQTKIVQEIESRLSVCDNLEKTITFSLQKSKALRQSILKKAFEGKLLTEEEIAICKAAPDYEPASVLLEKIKKGESRTSQSDKIKKEN